MGENIDPEREYRVKPYDFRRPDKFSREQLNVLRLIHRTLAGELTAVIGAQLGEAVEIDVASVDQCTFVEYQHEAVEQDSELAAWVVIHADPLPGAFVMQVDRALAQLLIRRACGQQGTAADAGDRAFSESETVILTDRFEGYRTPVATAWQSITAISPRVGGVETRVSDAQVVPPTEMVVSVRLSVTTGTQEFALRIGIPYLTLESHLGTLSAIGWYSTVRNPGSRPSLGSGAQAVPVQCELCEPLPAIPLSRLPAILAGEPLPLALLSRGELELRAGGVPVARVTAPSEESGLTALAVRSRRDEPEGQPAAYPAHDSASAIGAQLRSEIRELRLAIEGRNQIAEQATAGDDRSVQIDVSISRELALLLEREPAHVAAFVLAPLEPEVAAGVLSAISEDLRQRTVQSLLTLEEADSRLHARLLAALSRRLLARRSAGITGGATTAAEILSHVPRAVEASVMTRLQSEDHASFEAIASRLFVFEDFVLVNPSAIEKVADQFGAEEIALALKGVPGEVRQYFVGALRQEKAAALDAANASLGKVRRRDVEEVQRALIEELRRLEEAGAVVIARADEMVE